MSSVATRLTRTNDYFKVNLIYWSFTRWLWSTWSYRNICTFADLDKSVFYFQKQDDGSPDHDVHVIVLSHPQGLYSLSGKTSYRKISWSLEAARFGFKLFQSLWNLAGTSAAMLPRCLSNFRAIRPLQHPISRLRDFTRFGYKTSYCLVNRGPAVWYINMLYMMTVYIEICDGCTIKFWKWMNNFIPHFIMDVISNRC